MRPRIYISGPLTSSGSPEDNVDCAIEWMQRLIEDGMSPLCPHLSWYVDPDGQYPHETWMEVDLPWVEAADAVLRLPGFSNGADQEVWYAENHGIPVYLPDQYGDLIEDMFGVR